MTFVQYTASHKVHMAARSLPVRIAGAYSVIGSAVVDRQGQRVGELHDIMLDLSTGRIAYAVIALGSRASTDPLIVVPWNAVHSDQRAEGLRINAHADWIKRAPTVKRGYAPDQFAQDWGAFIHNYFGTRPYWEPPSAAQHS